MGRLDKLNERENDMKKRNIAISILVGLCACFIGAGASACGGKTGNKGSLKMDLSVDESYYIVAAARDKDCTEIIIPSEYKGKPVKEIGERAFYGCRSLTSIEIPEGVTWIGWYAFVGCKSLTSIEIPDSLMGIGCRAFSNCSSLTSVVLGDGVTEIGDYAFDDCSSLTGIEIPDSVTSICDGAFKGCSSLTDIEIPDSVTEIGNYAFYNCGGLTSIKIPDSVTEIGASAFRGCSSLMSIEIPDSVTGIGCGAFENCHGLTEITLPFVGATKGGEENTHLGYIFGASSYSENIDYVPASLKKVTVTGVAIAGKAFYDCTSLTSVVVGDGVTSIGRSAFEDCSSLTSVVIGDGVTSIGRSAFTRCYELTSITFEDTSTWYAVDNETDWENKTGGMEIDVTDSLTNATYFTFSYSNIYYSYCWFKL